MKQKLAAGQARRSGHQNISLNPYSCEGMSLQSLSHETSDRVRFLKKSSEGWWSLPGHKSGRFWKGWTILLAKILLTPRCSIDPWNMESGCGSRRGGFRRRIFSIQSRGEYLQSMKTIGFLSMTWPILSPSSSSIGILEAVLALIPHVRCKAGARL